MNDLPQPLTPADCDLAGYRWMPLDVERVIDSDTFGLCTGDEFKTAFRLWAKSWKQVPAASLPSDDRLLAHLAGLELPAWRRRKENALRGWILCSDGRLYHPVIAEKAIEAMGKRDAHAEREQNEETRQQRLRTRRKAMFEQLREHGIVPAYDTKTSELERLIASLPVTPNVTAGVTGDVTGDAPTTAIDTHTTGQGQDINPRGTSHALDKPASVRAKPAELSAAMRRHSIEAQPGDPRIIAAAENGITVETVEAACAEAKRKKQGQRANAGFVLSIADSWTQQAAAPRPPARSSPTNRSYHDERADTIAGLTGRNRGETPTATDDGVIDVSTTAIPRLAG